MPHELKDREIFAVGTWNGIDFSLDDLKDIVENFVSLRDTHKVPLKFGHDEDHKDGQPAIGWIERVFIKGNKLFADFADLPTVVFEAIKNKLYRTVSIELLFNVSKDGTRFNHVLDAVALLGADKPAVSGLADLDALLATRTAFSGGHRVAFNTVAGKRVVKKIGDNLFTVIDEDNALDEKDVQKIVDAAVGPLKEANVKLVADLEAANNTIAKFTTDKANDEKKVLEDKIKLARKSVIDVLDAAVRAKTMTPAVRETYERQIGLDDDERVIEINVEDIKKMFSVEDTDNQQGLHKDKDDDKESAGDKLMALTRKNQSETGKTDFAASFSLVCAANPKLHTEYLNANGEKTP